MHVCFFLQDTWVHNALSRCVTAVNMELVKSPRQEKGAHVTMAGSVNSMSQALILNMGLVTESGTVRNRAYMAHVHMTLSSVNVLRRTMEQSATRYSVQSAVHPRRAIAQTRTISNAYPHGIMTAACSSHASEATPWYTLQKVWCRSRVSRKEIWL